MPIHDLLLSEFDEEIKKTRIMLERVPEDKKDFTPHAKSMPLNKLAPHVAQLAGFGLTILTTPELDAYRETHPEDDGKALEAFLATVPTTLAGLRAALAYAVDVDSDCVPDNAGRIAATLLTYSPTLKSTASPCSTASVHTAPPSRASPLISSRRREPLWSS